MLSEQLEARNLLAGDITASVSGGTLRVIGDSQDNQVSVSVNDTGDLIVTGLNDTTVNGQSTPFVAVSGSNILSRKLVIRTQGGDDQITVDGVEVTNDLLVDTGRGNDVLEINSATVNGQTRISLGNQNDTLAIAALEARRRLLVDSRSGDDTLVFGDVNVGQTINADNSPLPAGARIRTGRGADRILIAGAMQVSNLLGIKTGSGNDSVIFDPDTAVDSATFGGARITLGKGADQVSISTSTTINNGIPGAISGVFTQLRIRGGKGVDTFQSEGNIPSAPTETNPFGTRVFSIDGGVDGTGTVDSQTIIDTVFADLTTAGVSVSPFGGQDAVQAPSVTTTDGSVTFNEGDGPLTIDSGITVTDDDSTDLASATVTVSSGFESSADVLDATSVSAITVAFDATTGTLSLTGTGSLADYQTVLRSVTYENTSDAPDTATRTITFEVTDPDGETGSATRLVDLVAVNDAPTVTASSTAVDYPTSGDAVALDDAIDVTDTDGELTGATVTINNVDADDVLAAVTTGTTISSSYDSTAGVLTLTGDASPEDYQQVLRTVTFETTETNPALDARTVEVVVNDGTETASVTYTITLRETAAPSVAGTSASGSFVEDGDAVFVDDTLVISDDGAELTGATVTIISGLDSEDTLTVTDTTGITSSFDSTTGILTLDGNASVADYQTVLRSVEFATAGNDPSVAIRTIEVAVTDTDGLTSSFERQFNITAVNDEPLLTASAVSVSYTEGDPAVLIDGSLVVADADDTELESATITLGSVQSAEDVITFDAGTTAISGTYNATTGILELTGSASVVDYQSVLRTLAYENTSTDPNETARTLEIVVSDGDATANVTYSIGVTAVEDP
ncbi:MAG: hypothetical protein AAF497_16080, partial [Planctomycetota bacterium]